MGRWSIWTFSRVVSPPLDRIISKQAEQGLLYIHAQKGVGEDAAPHMGGLKFNSQCGIWGPFDLEEQSNCLMYHWLGSRSYKLSVFYILSCPGYLNSAAMNIVLSNYGAGEDYRESSRLHGDQASQF